MPADRILVMDAGTSAIRAVIVAPDGVCATVAVAPWQMQTPDDAAPFGREFIAGDVERALRALLDRAAEQRTDIAAIACTGQREAIVFLDEDRVAIFASPNIDARSSAEGIAIDAAHAGEVYARTGHLPSLMQAPAKLAWLREHRPLVAGRIRYVLSLVDWLGALLTGELRMSRTLAAENGLLDIRTGTPPDDLLRMLDFEPALLPPIIDDGAIAGRVGAGAFVGVPVVLAGADTQCALVGCGAIDAGECAVPAGWSAPLQLVTTQPIFDCERRTWASVHVLAADRWILESNAGETGRAWEWLCSMMSIGHDEAEALAAAAPAGCDDTMSVLGPRSMHAAEMNAGVGAITLPLPLVMSSPDRGTLMRSVLESTAYAIRANLEQLEAVSGMTIARLSLGGGMSQSATFTQIVADVIDRPVSVAREAETSAVGAAMLASVAVGLQPTLHDAVRVMGSDARIVRPRASVSATYEDHYSRWCVMADEMQRLAAEA